MQRQELQIRLNPAQMANLSKGGRLVIDVDDPAPAEVTSAQISEATGQTVRVIPTTKKNNFRTSGTCCDCIGYNRRHGTNVFRCTKKTFKGDCYAMAALSRVCDLFQDKRISVPATEARRMPKAGRLPASASSSKRKGK